jgi:hypothetical protein
MLRAVGGAGQGSISRHKLPSLEFIRRKTHRVLRLHRESKHCKCSASVRSPRAQFDLFAQVSEILF